MVQMQITKNKTNKIIIPVEDFLTIWQPSDSVVTILVYFVGFLKHK